MAITKTLVLSAALAIILAVGQAATEGENPNNRASDDLQYRPNNGGLNPNSGDTNIIEDNHDQLPRPSMFGNAPDSINNGFSQQQQPRQRPGLTNFLPSFPLFGQGGFPGFGRGGLFGGLTDGFASPLRLPPFIDDVMNIIDEQTKLFGRQLKDLDFEAGEGQDVSYFNRNGVEYVRTCTTKRLDRNQPKPAQIPSQPNNILPIEDDKTDDLSEQKQQQPQPLPRPQTPPGLEQSDKSSDAEKPLPALAPPTPSR